MDFDNIAFTNPQKIQKLMEKINQSKDSSPISIDPDEVSKMMQEGTRYLTCPDCENLPLGLGSLNGDLYLATDLVHCHQLESS